MTEKELKKKRNERHSRILDLQKKIRENFDDVYQNLYKKGVVHEVPYTCKNEKIAEGWETRYLYRDNNIDVWMDKADEGVVSPEHTHPEKAELITVLQGVAKITIDQDREKIVPAQQSFYIPSGSKHKIKNVSKERLKIVTVYEPPLGVRINLNETD